MKALSKSEKAAPAAGPRLAVSRFPAPLHVSGGAPKVIRCGDVVNLDEVVGECDGVPVTVAESLGAYLSHFDVVGASAPKAEE